MRNFGLTDLRLVAPRDGWPNPHAVPMSAGAFEAGVSVQVFETVDKSLAGLSKAYATTARRRGIEKPIFGLETAIANAAQTPFGIMFGPENSGLDNADVSLCDGIITYPVDADFQSLNLAQAVGVAAYGWASTGASASPATQGGVSEPADKKHLFYLFDHLETELDSAGFFFPDNKRALMMNNIKNAIARAEWTEQEVQTFRGVIKALSKGRGPLFMSPNKQDET